MQVSEFTKALNYFLVGAMLMGVLTAWVVTGNNWDHRSLDRPASAGSPESKPVPIADVDFPSWTAALSPGAALVIVALMVPLAIFLGILLEALTSPVRLFFAWRASAVLASPKGEERLERRCWFFGTKKALLNMKLARIQFVSLLAAMQGKDGGAVCNSLHTTPTYVLPEINIEKAYRQLATSIVLNQASKETSAWIVGHYSTFVLCTNYAIAAPLCLALFVRSPWQLASALPVVYFLVHLALEKRFYAYETTYRSAFGLLALKTPEELEVFRSVLPIVSELETKHAG